MIKLNKHRGVIGFIRRMDTKANRGILKNTIAPLVVVILYVAATTLAYEDDVAQAEINSHSATYVQDNSNSEGE